MIFIRAPVEHHQQQQQREREPEQSLELFFDS